ncbi:hypothetical protein ACVWXM_007721 [Bradyrhizobium sp. GM7.3]
MAIFLNPNRPGPHGPQEVTCDGWPADHLQARDEIGAAIIAYRDRWMEHPEFPPSPWSPRRGAVHLPDLDNPEPEHDERPRYRLKAFGAVGAASYLAGTVLPIDHWPTNLWNLEPVNSSAERVVAYVNKFVLGRRMPGQPYDRARGQLSLPDPTTLEGKPDPFPSRNDIAGVGSAEPSRPAQSTNTVRAYAPLRAP